MNNFHDLVPLVLRRRNLSALRFPLILVLVLAFLQHSLYALLHLSESLQIGTSCVVVVLALGDGFECAIELVFSEPVVVWKALEAQSLRKLVSEMFRHDMCSSLRMLLSDRILGSGSR